MDNQEISVQIDTHKKFAVDLFNEAWGMYDKKDRTQDEDDAMINAAHASAYHWSMLKGHIDETRWLQSTPRSHNQLANAYIALKRPEPALYHACRCVDLCKERGIADFDIAFGYECLARAHDVAGDIERRNEYLKLAFDAADGIAGKEDKDFFLSELEKSPGFHTVPD